MIRMRKPKVKGTRRKGGLKLRRKGKKAGTAPAVPMVHGNAMGGRKSTRGGGVGGSVGSRGHQKNLGGPRGRTPKGTPLTDVLGMGKMPAGAKTFGSTIGKMMKKKKKSPGYAV